MRTDPIIITGTGHSGTRGLVEVFMASDSLFLGSFKNYKNEWEYYRDTAVSLNSELLGLPINHDHNMIPPEIYHTFRIEDDTRVHLANQITDNIIKYREFSLPPKDCIAWVIKSPRMVLCLEIWHTIFPNAKFVNLIRDGRDVAASLPPEAGTLKRRFNLWRARVTRMREYKKRGYPVVEFKYEDLPNKRKVERLCEELKIPYTPAMMDQIKMNTGKGVRAMAGLPYEKYELLQYNYPVKNYNSMIDKIIGLSLRIKMANKSYVRRKKEVIKKRFYNP